MGPSSSNLRNRPTVGAVNVKDVARDALRALVLRKLDPTPDNYRRLYYEIARIPAPTDTGAEAEQALIALAAKFPRAHTPAQSSAKNMESLASRRSWGLLVDEVLRLAAELDTTGRAPEPRLAVASLADRESPQETFRELLVQCLRMGIAPLLAHDAPLASGANDLAETCRLATTTARVAELRAALRQFLLQVDIAAGDAAELQSGLLRVMRLLMTNIAELLADDQWMKGQIDTVSSIIDGRIELRSIEAAERSLKEAIFRQGTLKHSLAESRDSFKGMVTSFIDRLGEFSESTGSYHGKIESLSARIKSTEDVIELGRLLDEVAGETRTIQAATQRSRDEVQRAREQVAAAERKIRELEAELTAASEKVREDQLTGTLNRRGFEHEYDRAAAASERRSEPLALALLDIDNFKSLNDTHGHQAGDGALVHLATVIKSAVRPSDMVCRYGGEEFIVLLPATDEAEAAEAMTRVQRELTRRFFLHANQRLLITFSAGVAVRRTGETRDAVVARADAAMYQAKRSGKNRVVAAQ